MKFYTDEEADELYEAGKVEFAIVLKDKTLSSGNSIELWYSGNSGKPEIVHNHYLPEKKGFCLFVEMNCAGQFVELETDNLIKACEAFNTVYETMTK